MLLFFYYSINLAKAQLLACSKINHKSRPWKIPS
uniref:Uncharacterized protein n=1 Tax=Anguilla anguilla TaxID=7936 RepID=A0A0E9W1K5_ANGAN